MLKLNGRNTSSSGIIRMKGWFDAFRHDGGPTLYDRANRTAVTGDVPTITFCVIFITLFVAFLIVLPGMRKEVSDFFLQLFREWVYACGVSWSAVVTPTHFDGRRLLVQQLQKTHDIYQKNDGHHHQHQWSCQIEKLSLVLRRPQTFSFSSGRIFTWDPKGSRSLLFSRRCKKRLDFWIANGRPRMFLSVRWWEIGKQNNYCIIASSIPSSVLTNCCEKKNLRI